MNSSISTRRHTAVLVNRRSDPAHPLPRKNRRRGCPALRSLAAAMLVVGLTIAGQAQARSMESYQPLIIEAADRFAIPPHWIRAVIVAESAADPQAVSDKGAMGLMQIMPETWDELRAQHDLGPDPFAPADNIVAGTAYLRQMLNRYGSVTLMLAAYNAGPSRVEDHLATGRTLPNETLDYVANLLPELSEAHSHLAFTTPENAVYDRLASTLFVPIGAGFDTNSERSMERFSSLGATVQRREPTSSMPDGVTSHHELFVQPNTRQRP